MQRLWWMAALAAAFGCGGGGTGNDGGDHQTACAPQCTLGWACVEGQCVPDEDEPPALVMRTPATYETRISTPLVFQFDEPLRPLNAGDVVVTNVADGGVLPAQVTLAADAGTVTVVPSFEPPVNVQIAFPGVKDIATNVTAQPPIAYSFPNWILARPPEVGSAAQAGGTFDAEGRPIMVLVEYEIPYVKRLDDDGVWRSIGDLTSITDARSTASIDARGGELVVLTASRPSVISTMTVRRWTGTTWESLGDAYVGYAYTGVLRLDSQLRPVVAAVDAAVTVSRWSGSAWESLGSVATAADPRFSTVVLAFDGEDRPMVAYPDEDASGAGVLVVARYENGSWVRLGDPFANPTSHRPALVREEDGTILLVWLTDTAVNASRWTGSDWATAPLVTLGSTEVTRDVVAGVVAGDATYVAWTDGSDRLSLVKSQGNDWTALRTSSTAAGTPFAPTNELMMLGGVPAGDLWLVGERTVPAEYQAAFYNR